MAKPDDENARTDDSMERNYSGQMSLPSFSVSFKFSE